MSHRGLCPQDLIHFSEADIKELGVRNSSHRARLMSSLVALKAKYEKGERRQPRVALCPPRFETSFPVGVLAAAPAGRVGVGTLPYQHGVWPGW